MVRPRRLLIIPLMVAGALTACGGDEAPEEAVETADATPQDTPGEPDVGQPPTTATVVLNEVRCTGGDWIELFNTSTLIAADLSGFVLTDDPGQTDHAWAIPGGTTLEPSTAIVFHREPGSLPFGISCGDDSIVLLDTDGAVVDEVALPSVVAGGAWGRIPDGLGAFVATDPTPGEANRVLPDGPEVLFGDTVVFIDLTLSQTAMSALGAEPKTWVSGTFRAAVPGVGAKPIEVGIRLKGGVGSFRPLSGKAAFKIKFNQTPGRRFLGLKHLTLNNMVQDRTRLHEAAAYTVFRAFDVPAPRVGYAWVRLNGEDYGLYANIEAPDDVFLAQHYPSTKHLYEGEYGTDVVPGAALEFEVDEGDAADLSDLEALIEAASAAPGGWLEAVSAVADLAQLQRAWAVEMYVGHWDGHAVLANNYRLHSDQNGVFSLLPWGTDQTFSSHLAYADGTSVLFTGCMAVPECRDDYIAAVEKVVALVESLSLDGWVSQRAAALAPWIELDTRGGVSAAMAEVRTDQMRAFLETRGAETNAFVECASAGNPDVDGDGEGCLSDCNDKDPSVHTGATDTCEDGIDQDCNGTADDGLSCPADCKPLWRGEHRYLVCQQKRTYAEARAHCQALGADVVILNTAGEEAWLRKQSKVFLLSKPWLGLTDEVEEGSFVAVDGSMPGYTNWAQGEPNNGVVGENCVQSIGQAGWNDIHCSALGAVICEDLCNEGDADTDGDGHSACGDDCHDGDPTVHAGAPEQCGGNVDHDCSGAASDVPGCAEACQELTLLAITVTWCPMPMAWDAARSFCQSLGSDLLWLDSVSQGTAAAQAVWGVAQWYEAWIGLSDTGTEGTFAWVTGTSLNFDAWSGGQPNDSGGQDCVALLGEGTWNDKVCGLPRPFLCRKP